MSFVSYYFSPHTKSYGNGLFINCFFMRKVSTTITKYVSSQGCAVFAIRLALLGYATSVLVYKNVEIEVAYSS